MRYLLKENRFLRQKGEDQPRYIAADPDHPTVVEMDDEVQAFDHASGKWKTVPFSDPRLQKYEESEEKPHIIPAHADLKNEAVPSAARLQGPTPPAQPKRTRVADA